MTYKPSIQKIGVLGGGQLGKMLAEAAYPLDISLSFLDISKTYPAGKISPNFTEGNFNDFDDVIQFGMDKDILTIEIEHVNIDALEELEKRGKKIFPQPSILRMIQDKGSQKMFLEAKGYPTAPFKLFASAESIIEMWNIGVVKIPFVQKLRKGGYDGKGVLVVSKDVHLNELLEGPCVVERMAAIDKEIAVIAVRNTLGECTAYPAVSMDFHPIANLVEYVVCPAEIPAEIEIKAQKLALRIIQDLQLVGVLAIEMFYNTDGSLWINELAPRPHNSGHHSINNGSVSQFENHLRAILGWPLGNTEAIRPAIMINLLGEDGFSGQVQYEGLQECLAKDGIHLHLYGKNETKPFRKMGHVTVTDQTMEACKEKATFVQHTLKVTA